MRQSGPLASNCLFDEIGLIAAAVGRRKIGHLHWGGGTPSILGEQRLAAIINALDATFGREPYEHHLRHASAKT
jgi:oxygen-independent coproporphyrinogen-3 oxidase